MVVYVKLPAARLRSRRDVEDVQLVGVEDLARGGRYLDRVKSEYREEGVARQGVVESRVWTEAYHCPSTIVIVPFPSMSVKLRAVKGEQ